MSATIGSLHRSTRFEVASLDRRLPRHVGNLFGEATCRYRSVLLTQACLSEVQHNHSVCLKCWMKGQSRRCCKGRRGGVKASSSPVTHERGFRERFEYLQLFVVKAFLVSFSIKAGEELGRNFFWDLVVFRVGERRLAKHVNRPNKPTCHKAYADTELDIEVTREALVVPSTSDTYTHVYV